MRPVAGYPAPGPPPALAAAGSVATARTSSAIAALAMSSYFRYSVPRSRAPQAGSQR